jgi:hypothetical protein
MTETRRANVLGAEYVCNPDGGGRTVRGLTEVYGQEDDMTDKTYFALEALDSLVLAHFCAGINVCSTEYLDGLATALDAIGNHLAGEGV